MAQKQEFTLEELNKMNKPELIQLAESLHIKAQNLHDRRRMFTP